MWGQQQFGGGFGPAGGSVAQVGANVCGGLCCGLLMFFFNVWLIFWNEGMAVQTSQSLAEGLSAVRSISAKPSDAEMRQLEGHLVHLTSPLQTERVTDDQFGVTVEAMRLKRSVRMLQWVERSRQVTSREFDGYGNSREVSRTEYFQVQSWETTVHEMHTFHNSNPQLGGNSHAQIGANGHYQAANYHQGGGAVGLYPPNPPSMPFDSVQVKAASSRAGAFEVTDVLLSQLGDGDKLALRSDKVKNVPQGYSIVNGNLQSFLPGRQPQIGDVIIEFRALYPDTVSIVAKARRGELVAYQTRAGDSLAMIKVGAESAEKMFQEAEDWNTFRTWALRGLGLFLMFVSFNMILSPVASVFGIVPLLGPLLQSIVGAGVAIAAAGLAISVSALICAVAWLWYRPFVSIALLAAALVPIYLLPKRGAAVVHPRAPGENFARTD